MDPTIIKCMNETNDLSLTCMTLSEFKAQWMIVLQCGHVESQISIQHNDTNTNTNNSNNTETIYTKTKHGNNKVGDKVKDGLFSTEGRYDIQRLRKRRRLGRRQNIETLGSSMPKATDKSTSFPPEEETIHDNYDCYHQVTIPSSHDAIDMVVDDVIQQWRALDERKISATTMGIPSQNETQQPPNNNNHNNTNNNKPLPKWYEKHIRLPDGFDYASIRKEPPTSENNTDPHEDRVINFMDPTQPLSYRTELWKLFHSIPTRSQIEESLCTPHQLPNMERWFHDDNINDTNNNDGTDIGIGGGAILQGTKSCSSTDWDFYGLSRFRLNDRHDLPPIIVNHRQPTTATATSTTTTLGDSTNISNTQYVGLLRLECVRKQFRRTSTPDPNRMVLEFLESHTLYDVHNAIVELTDDELWYDYAKTVPISNTSIPNDDDDDEAEDADEEGGDRDDEHNNNASNDRTAGNSNEINTAKNVSQPSTDRLNNGNDTLSSGYFFIENTFYTTGTVDYTTPILQWLQTGTIREQKRRMEHLGIGPTLPTIQSMTDMKLCNLPTRLGVRYVHVHHGDVECAIFITDRRLMLPEQVQQIHQFPIIHDVWTSSYNIPECDVCQSRVAIIATSTECHVTNGHIALCEICCRQLRLPQTSRKHIERYTIWRGQSDLSAGASKEVAW